ncbi:hypothetical protein D3C79_674480 [compost metagenome]
MAAGVVTHESALVGRHFIQILDQRFNAQRSQLRVRFQHGVRVVDVSLVVFGVMDFHRLLVEMRFQCVVGVRQGWQ